VTLITINFPSDGFYALFTGHHPAELCGSDDYTSCFRDQHGQVVSILLEEEHDHEEEHHEEGRSDGSVWLYTLLGCGLCWLVVFSGLIFMVCGSQKYDELTRRHLNLLNLFASGAILATVLFLILIESYHFLEAVGMEEGDTAAVFGTCILGGFISPTLIELIVFREDIEPNDIISSHVVEMVEEVKYKPVKLQTHVEDKVAVVEEIDQADLTTFEENKCETISKPVDELSNRNQTAEGEDLASNPNALEKSIPETPWKFDRIVISVICGDFLHNFCDGIFIGVAVRSCSLSLMWTIILVTMFHEFAQELSDFVILTTKVGLSVPRALTLNAIGGFSVILGGIFTNLFDLSDLVIGAFLAYGSGNLVYLSAAELFPLLHISSDVKAKVTSVDKLQGLLCFCVGAFVIGLTLLRHEHCEADGEADGGGHNH
jgi:UTP--glucose-1-phosphate uridylyltransferase